MTERELSKRLAAEPAPGEEESGERAWQVVHAAFASRERVRWPRRHRGTLILAFAVAAAVVAALTPPGRAVVEEVRDAVGRTPSTPALVRLPTAGRLLVVSESGPWVVRQDGSKRFLGHYDDASWSPRGLFVVATRGNQLVALDPETGDERWSLSREEPISDPRWSGGGLDTRIAYRAGRSLHVVAGDGSPDAVLAEDVAPVAPAWRPDSHVVAYAMPDGRVHVVDADSSRELWTTPRIVGIRRIDFGEQGRLLVVTRRNASLYGRRGLIRVAASRPLAQGHELLDAVALPGGRVLYADYDRKANATALVLAHCFAPGPCLLIGPSEVFKGAGRTGNLIRSPDRRWLVMGWPAPDQLLFFRVANITDVEAVSHVSQEFEPGAPGRTAFPQVVGWAPPAP
jgi:hypothetical protein